MFVIRTYRALAERYYVLVTLQNLAVAPIVVPLSHGFPWISPRNVVPIKWNPPPLKEA